MWSFINICTCMVNEQLQYMYVSCRFVPTYRHSIIENRRIVMESNWSIDIHVAPLTRPQVMTKCCRLKSYENRTFYIDLKGFQISFSSTVLYIYMYYKLTMLLLKMSRSLCRWVKMLSTSMVLPWSVLPHTSGSDVRSIPCRFVETIVAETKEQTHGWIIYIIQLRWASKQCC